MGLLEARNLGKEFHSKGRYVRALDRVNLSLDQGDCVAIVGETGSGKSTLAKIVLGLLEHDSGDLTFRDEPWHGGWTSARDKKRLDIQPVFQNPRQSLNPRRTIRDALQQAIDAGKRRGSGTTPVELLERVGLNPAEKYLSRMPRELSGGEQQRVTIARALAVRPALIVADEPTSALDVSLRAGVLNLLREVQMDDGVAILLITHDMLVAEAMSTRMLVMKQGQVVEAGATKLITGGGAENEYTKRLLAAAPDLDSTDW